MILDAVSEQGAAVVTWETPTEENGLITRYGIFVDGEGEPVTQVGGDEHSASVVDLEPCLSIGLAVKAQNGAGWGESSGVENVTVVDDGKRRMGSIVSVLCYKAFPWNVSSYFVDTLYSVHHHKDK